MTFVGSVIMCCAVVGFALEWTELDHLQKGLGVIGLCVGAILIRKGRSLRKRSDLAGGNGS